MTQSNVFSYEVWRATVPWTDQEIVEALRAHADAMPNAFMASRIRSWADHLATTGRLSSESLGYALDRLVTKCAICGKVAHYRIGSAGRCRAHRDVKTDYYVVKQRRLEKQWSDFIQKARVRDKAERSHASINRSASKTAKRR